MPQTQLREVGELVKGGLVVVGNEKNHVMAYELEPAWAPLGIVTRFTTPVTALLLSADAKFVLAGSWYSFPLQKPLSAEKASLILPATSTSSG